MNSTPELLMEKDRFDHKMIDIEQKTFELGMLMSVFAFEILETFDGNFAEINTEINYTDMEGSSLRLETESVVLNRDTGEISVNCTGVEKSLIWDDLDLTAKIIIINELHYRYKSEKLYKGFSDDGGIH